MNYEPWSDSSMKKKKNFSSYCKISKYMISAIIVEKKENINKPFEWCKMFSQERIEKV